MSIYESNSFLRSYESARHNSLPSDDNGDRVRILKRNANKFEAVHDLSEIDNSIRAIESIYAKNGMQTDPILDILDKNKSTPFNREP